MKHPLVISKEKPVLVFEELRWTMLEIICTCGMGDFCFKKRITLPEKNIPTGKMASKENVSAEQEYLKQNILLIFNA
ncbi:MAG: hypothetical protein H7122_02490 [Chitinophagaceae bacterium]|nr:hypothetical protein [Chitinophagaceae bacterium]